MTFITTDRKHDIYRMLLYTYEVVLNNDNEQDWNYSKLYSTDEIFAKLSSRVLVICPSYSILADLMKRWYTVEPEATPWSHADFCATLITTSGTTP